MQEEDPAIPSFLFELRGYSTLSRQTVLSKRRINGKANSRTKISHFALLCKGALSLLMFEAEAEEKGGRSDVGPKTGRG